VFRQISNDEVKYMPLEIEMNHSAPVVSVLFSETVELITMIYALNNNVKIQQNEYISQIEAEWHKNIVKKLSPKSLEMLKIVTSFRLGGLELIEFVLREETFSDIPLLLKKIDGYKDADFIYTFTGEEISIERIEKIMNNRDELTALKKEELCFIQCDPRWLEILFYETNQFKKSIIKLMEEIYNSNFVGKINSLKELYCREIVELRKHLESQLPIEYAQEMMGRKFRKIFDFREYFFIPSYFIQPKRIRFFNQQVQMIIYGVDSAQDSVHEIGNRISTMLKVLSDRTRLEIMRVLMAEGPSYGKLLADNMNLTTATISHHLEQLRDMGLVTEKRKKNIKYFAANTEALELLFIDSKKYFFEHLNK
jgi:DNA-binding transcriptional ArsR family regulator